MKAVNKYGLRTALFLAKRKIKSRKNNYNNYIKYEDRNSLDLPPLEIKPLISVILYGGGNYEDTLNSLKNQTNYGNFEIIVVSDRDVECEASVVITERGCDRNTAYKIGLEIAQGEYVGFADENMVFSDTAIYYMIRQLSYEDYDIIYSDEDIIENGIRKNPFFKPGWSPDTLRSFNYIGFAFIKRELIKEFTDYYSLLLELSYKDINVSNVEKILLHMKRTEREENTVEKYRGERLVSIIIPSRDNYEVLKRCIDSIRDKSEYKNYEIIVVDNGSENSTKSSIEKIADKYIYEKCDFNFSKMCNMGAENAEGGFLLFLNDDTEVISADWLNVMLSYCENERTGAVGCKLIYPKSNKIQHCGIVNIQNGPVHCFQGYDENNDLYFGRNKYSYNYSAVTGACLLIKKEIFYGFDESLPVAYNDVDLCLSLLEKGYFNVVVNSVKLYHYESLTRGDDREEENKLKRLYIERDKLNKKHGLLCYKDKFYNRNLTQHRADFTIENTDYINRGRFGKALNPLKYVTDKINGEIEYVKEGDMAEIGGYAYINGEITETYIIIMTRSDVAVPIKANAELRYDISAREGINVNMWGFSANINTCMFEEGCYQLGIMLVNRITGKKHIKIFKNSINIK